LKGRTKEKRMAYKEKKASLREEQGGGVETGTLGTKKKGKVGTEGEGGLVEPR